MTKQQTEPQEERQEEEQTPEPTIWDRLAEPFPPEELEWKIQACGKKGDRIWARIVPYVQSRAIMARLDEVVTPPNWQDEYIQTPCGKGYMCLLSIRHPSRPEEWVTKTDGAEPTQIEKVKGAFSDALKRTAVKWGMGRHLYDMSAAWADIGPDNLNNEQKKSGVWQKGKVKVGEQNGKPVFEWFNWCVPDSLRTGKTTEELKQQRNAELDKKDPMTDAQAAELEAYRDDPRVNGLVATIAGKEEHIKPYLHQVLIERERWNATGAKKLIDFLMRELGSPRVEDKSPPEAGWPPQQADEM